MKTAEERAKNVIKDFHNLNINTFDISMTELIIKALKEQDKITRHACAEAIAFVDDNEEHDAVLGNAIRACMNTKNV